MKSRLLLIAVALAYAACTGEPQSSSAPAAPVGVTASPGTSPSEAAPAKPDQVAESAEQGRAGRPHHTGAASAADQGRAGRPQHTGAASAADQGRAGRPPHTAAAPAAPLAASEPRRITPEELRPLMDAQRAVLVDVRGASDWAFHRAAEAIHIPYDQLRARSAELPHEPLIALYCT